MARYAAGKTHAGANPAFFVLLRAFLAFTSGKPMLMRVSRSDMVSDVTDGVIGKRRRGESGGSRGGHSRENSPEAVLQPPFVTCNGNNYSQILFLHLCHPSRHSYTFNPSFARLPFPPHSHALPRMLESLQRVLHSGRTRVLGTIGRSCLSGRVSRRGRSRLSVRVSGVGGVGVMGVRRRRRQRAVGAYEQHGQ